MDLKEGLAAVLIHLVIPLSGLIYYYILYNKMKDEEIEHPPFKEIFILFATYGGLLLVILTTFFWFWSGMASLGFFYLLIGAPIVLGFIGTSLNTKKEISPYHYWSYKAAVWYFAIGPLSLLVLFLVVNHLENQ